MSGARSLKRQFPGDGWRKRRVSNGRRELAVPESMTVDPETTETSDRSANRARDASAWPQVDVASTIATLQVGQKCRLRDLPYVVRDVKEVEILAVEGQLPFTATPGRRAWSVDLGGKDRAFVNLESSAAGARFFLGRYLEFAELNFTQLRPVPGWTADAAETIRRQSTALNCPKCAAPVVLRSAGLAVTAVCDSCLSWIDVSHPQLQIIGAVERQQRNPEVPLGRRGELNGVTFECIGYQRRRDSYGETWSEHLCFNPFVGFRWLIYYHGHWTWVDPVLDEIPVREDRLDYGGREYRLFANATAETTYVLGEFYWRVQAEEKSTVRDYVAPPHILSAEESLQTRDLSWSHGCYLEPAVVAAAFGAEVVKGAPRGIYLNQPNPGLAKRPVVWSIWAVAIGALLVTQLAYWARVRSRVVMDKTFPLSTDPAKPPLMTENFELLGRDQILRIRTEVPLNNAWADVGVALIHTNRGRLADFTHALEYYSGYDGGFWEEGARQRTTTIPGLPPGTYFLELDAAADVGVPAVEARILVERDVFSPWNLVMGIGLLSIYPLWLTLRNHNFERKRWSESDYSPYPSSED